MRTWEDLKSADELFSDAERGLIRELEMKRKTQEPAGCPHLRKEGGYFYYCGIQAGDVKLELTPTNPVMRSRQSPSELQIWCMNKGNYENCIFYRQSGKSG